MGIKILNEILWSQFGASIEILENAIKACPEELWSDRTQLPEFWYLVYQTLFWLDFYLTDSPDDFTLQNPFTLSELDPDGIMPDRVYTNKELLNYLDYGRKKCKQVIENLNDE